MLYALHPRLLYTSCIDHLYLYSSGEMAQNLNVQGTPLMTSAFKTSGCQQRALKLRFLGTQID